MRHAILAAALLVVPVAAQAQDRPQIFPTRDVAVTYRVTGRGPAAELTMLWSAAQRLMRMTMPEGVGYVVTDHQNQRGFVVMEAMRAIMDIPLSQAGGFQRDLENARFTRGSTEKIAGHDCTVWRYQGQGQAQEGEACITADGVVLRASGAARGQAGTMQAVRLAYGPQDPGQFRRPQGYQTMQMPQGIPQGAPRQPTPR